MSNYAVRMNAQNESLRQQIKDLKESLHNIAAADRSSIRFALQKAFDLEIENSALKKEIVSTVEEWKKSSQLAHERALQLQQEVVRRDALLDLILRKDTLK